MREHHEEHHEHHEHHRRGRGRGPENLAEFLAGFGGPGPRGPFGPRWGGGPRARRDVRSAVLLLLEEQPRHGYELIQEITERSNGSWTPSAGSIYPTLQSLEDEGLITIEPVQGRKTASLTEEGVTYVTENRDKLGSPWDSSAEPAWAAKEGHQFRAELMAFKDAAVQVMRAGTADQQKAATAVIAGARKDLYRLLADADS
jgi:DNA-binding PadR family transcriptional regulator